MDKKINIEDTSNPKNGNSAVRDSLVNTAVQFLQNPKLQSSPLNMKKDFLQKKGLTEEEVELAIHRSGVTNNSQLTHPVGYNDQVMGNPMLLPPPVPYYPQHMTMIQPVPSRLMWLRDLANCIVSLGGAAYIVYWLYKRYVEPFLFGRKKKEIEKNPVETELIKLNNSFERVNICVERLEQKLEFTSHRNQAEEQELIAVMNSLKGLLLNRKQFPAVPAASGSTGPASIPSWQLSEGQPPSNEDNKKLDSSPSNSSNNSTNNDGTSDSSLEVIKEQEIINSK